MSANDRDVEAFLEHLDTLAERLRPKRRPQDAGARACSPRELRALALLGKRGRVTMSTLAQALDVPLSTATRIVEGLVRKGLVERKPSKADRRIVHIGFGRRGKRINEHVKRARSRRASAMLSVLPARDRATLLSALARIVDAKTVPGAAAHGESVLATPSTE